MKESSVVPYCASCGELMQYESILCLPAKTDRTYLTCPTCFKNGEEISPDAILYCPECYSPLYIGHTSFCSNPSCPAYTVEYHLEKLDEEYKYYFKLDILYRGEPLCKVDVWKYSIYFSGLYDICDTVREFLLDVLKKHNYDTWYLQRIAG